MVVDRNTIYNMLDGVFCCPSSIFLVKWHRPPGIGHPKIVSQVRKRSCLYSRTAEKACSRKLVVASPATNIPFYSAQSSVTP